MIGRLRGQLVDKRPPSLLLDVAGVGYEIEAPMSTFYDLPELGQEVTLLTHLLVREDAQLLYGFSREGERRLFRALIKVSGVGARMALAILSGMDAARFAQCVEQQDCETLIRIPGIGKKTAQRLVVELRDRLDPPLGAGAPGGPVQIAHTSADPRDQACADAVGALVALGYRPADAARMIRNVDDGALPSEELIRLALRAVSPA